MKPLKWEDVRTIIRTPKILITAAVLVGLTVNMFVFSAYLLPKWQQKMSLDNQLDNLTAQRKQWESRPLPAKLSTADLDKLVKQIPLTDDAAGLLVDLKRIEAQSGAVIFSLTVPGQASPKDVLTEYVEAQKQGTGAAKPTPPVSPAPTPVPAAAQAKPATSQFNEQKFQLTVDGTYRQTLDFINLLYQLERIVAVNNWSLQPFVAQGNTTATVSPGPTAAADAAKNRLAMEIVCYAAPSYAGKFGNAAVTTRPLPSLPPAAGRTDPTMSDEAYLQLLESLKRTPN